MSRVRVDIETRSRVNLRKTSVYRYVRCPDFRILMAGWSIDGGPVWLTTDRDETLDTLSTFRRAGDLLVAHSATFERICFSTELGMPVGRYLDPEEFHDTQAVAAELGYPQKLEKLAKALGGEQKDEAGTYLINLFSKPNRAGGWNGPDTHPHKWFEFGWYCAQDVSTLNDVDDRLEEQGGWPTDHERRVYLADQRINDRGIRIDVDLAEHAVVVGSDNAIEQKARFRELSGVENPGSVPQRTTWAASEGLSELLPNWQKETVEKALETDLSPVHREVLELHQELALAAPKKFAAATYSVLPDNRLRGTLAFGGAHTLRWAGRGTQIQNLPRLAFKPEGADAERIAMMKDLGYPKQEIEAFEAQVIERMTSAAIADILLGLGASAETLKKLVRAMFIVDGSVVDYSAIEARVIAWLAGEAWVLQAFREGRDLYVETGDRMGGLPRSDGKVAVLALGYNGGPDALRRMAGDNLTFALADDEELYERYVWPWRAANPNTVRLWKLLETRFRSGGPVGEHLRFEKSGSDRFLVLPSGRAICYRKCGIQRVKVLDKKSGKLVERERLTFLSPKGYREDTYGGKLAENVTQAVARDLLAAALVRLEDRGLRVVGHVHDEILVEGETDVELVRKIMCELPDWATGLPVDGQGFTTYRYRKG